MPTDSPAPAEPDAPGRRELILRMLRAAAAPRSIASIADELGVHTNTVRFHLDALRRAGRVEQVLGDTSGPGRPPILFRATRTMDPGGPTNYQLLATMLTDHLATTSRDPAAAATDLGRRWGPQLIDAPPRDRPSTTRVSRSDAVARMVAVLSDLGFAPEPPPAGRPARDIRLRHCPFLGLADEHGEVICSVHLGLMQGALRAMAGPVTVDRLDPFVEPDLCVAHLAPAGRARSAGTTTRQARRGQS